MTLFITAEIGTHWKGNYGLLANMVASAYAVGFDAVKFQAFRLEDLNSRPYRMNSTVTADNVEKIDKICKSIGIEWYCMPTYVEAVDFLDPYVKRYKVRYRDSDDISLLTKILSRGKPVIISCEDPQHLKSPQITHMYCINKYPHSYQEIDFEKMKKFEGFSCHAPYSRSVIDAVILSHVKYIELHVTYDMDDETLADNCVAFTFDRCKTLIERVRKIDKK